MTTYHARDPDATHDEAAVEQDGEFDPSDASAGGLWDKLPAKGDEVV